MTNKKNILYVFQDISKERARTHVGKDKHIPVWFALDLKVLAERKVNNIILIWDSEKW